MPNNGHLQNLDKCAAQYAQAVIVATAAEHKPADVDNTATKALGVLQENGVYACALYLLSRKLDELPRAKAMLDQMISLLGPDGLGFPEPPSNTHTDILKYMTDYVVVDLHRALLAKQTLEQMLIYVRYGAKARKASEATAAPDGQSSEPST